MASTEEAYTRIFGDLKAQKAKGNGLVTGIIVTIVILTLLIAFLVYDRSRCGPVYTAMRARLDATGETVQRQVEAVKEVLAVAPQEGLANQFGGLEGSLAPGSQAAEAYAKFEEDAGLAHSLARRDEVAVDADLAEGFENLTGEKRDGEADRQLQKWKAHCSKNLGRSDMERETYVESKGHSSLGCDINRHILASFRGQEASKPAPSSGRFTCFQDSSHRHQQQQAPSAAEMTEFPIMEDRAEGTQVGEIGQSGFFNE